MSDALTQLTQALAEETARRVAAEHALETYDRDFTDFVENGAVCLHQVGADGTILWANHAELTFLGYEAADYVGQHIAKFHVDQPTIDDILVKLSGGQTILDYPARLRCKNGDIKYVMIHSNGRFDQEHLRYTRCFTRDVTDQVLNGEIIRERNDLLREAPVAAALLMGPEHRFELANDLYKKIVGRPDIEGKTYREAFPELNVTDVLSILDRVYASGEPFVAEEYPMVLGRNGDGRLEERVFQFNLQPLRRITGEVYGVMAVAVDITELIRAREVQKESQAEREVLLEDLEIADRAKDEFLAMLGHELRNPLAPIVTALDLMKRRGELKTSREQDVIHRQVQHLIRLVDDLLDVSRVARGKVVLRQETVEVADVLSKAVEMVSLLLEQREHVLQIDVPASGLRWLGDPTRLTQVVSNLLTNAARYTKKGGLIELYADHQGDDICIVVKDNGNGIAPELLPRIFDRFFQGYQSQERSQGGLGIGLALVKSLVAAHGGTVAAASDGAGHGSVFTVRLPVAALADADADPASMSSVPQSASPQTKNLPVVSRRVLIVDDNKDAADLLSELLKVGGHQTAVAYDPVSALDLSESFQPEVAFLDIGLPVMDGYELAVQLRKELGDAAPCRMFALTGFGQAIHLENSRRAGMSGHFLKPVDLPSILAAIDDTAVE